MGQTPSIKTPPRQKLSLQIGEGWTLGRKKPPQHCAAKSCLENVSDYPHALGPAD